MQDSDRAASAILNDKLRGFIVSAREACENYTNRVFITQTWLLGHDGFPWRSLRYQGRLYPGIALPKPPFQSIDFFRYVDTGGIVQDLTVDATYGNSMPNPQYAYQLMRGDEIKPGMLVSPWARPWPPARAVPDNVLIQMRCGYGGPITVSIAQDSGLLTSVSGIKFNPDDAPLLVGDTGLPISIPGAGPGSAALKTFVTSVDLDGNATLADQATVAVTGVIAWAGVPTPSTIGNAIKVTVESYYDLGYASDDIPDGAKNMLKPYLNWTA